MVVIVVVAGVGIGVGACAGAGVGRGVGAGVGVVSKLQMFPYPLICALLCPHLQHKCGHDVDTTDTVQNG